jgi:hypothetical protein
MQANCVAIKGDGIVCGKTTQTGGNRCRMHAQLLVKNGRHFTEKAELLNILKKEKSDRKKITDDLVAREEDPTRKANLMINHTQTEAGFKRIANLRLSDLRRRHMEENIAVGGNVDAEANARRDRIQQERAMQIQRRNADYRVQAAAQRQAAAAAVAEGPAQAVTDLRHFATDAQNVHRTSTVQMVTRIVNEVLKIHVPEPYKWNMTTCSLTPGEIIIQCSLTPSAAWQMQVQYCQANTIYEMEPGIYGKVLDCVWQYIKGSPDIADLKRILKQELQDNIGMCAQGNLSRLCNILAGYVDGVGSQESKTEKLGRLLPPLAEIEDIHDRLDAGIAILRENEVLEEEWTVWLEPLFDGENVGFAYDEGEMVIMLVGN